MKTKNKIDLYDLASRISNDFDIPLLIEGINEKSNGDLSLIYENDSLIEGLSLLKFNDLGFERFRIENKNYIEELKVSYMYSNINFFKETFKPFKSENEFLNDIFKVYDEFANSKTQAIITKIIPNDQKNLEDLAYYMAKKLNSDKIS